MPLDMARNLKLVTSWSYRSTFQSLFDLFSTGSDLAKYAAIIYGRSIGDGLPHQPLAEVVYNTGNYKDVNYTVLWASRGKDTFLQLSQACL